jgi:hypothetical protein
LALFGRRLQEPADSFAIPATENLHNFRLMHCSKASYSITSSALTSSAGDVITPQNAYFSRACWSNTLSSNL